MLLLLGSSNVVPVGRQAGLPGTVPSSDSVTNWVVVRVASSPDAVRVMTSVTTTVEGLPSMNVVFVAVTVSCVGSLVFVCTTVIVDVCGWVEGSGVADALGTPIIELGKRKL